jgi:hypothetical protein
VVGLTTVQDEEIAETILRISAKGEMPSDYKMAEAGYSDLVIEVKKRGGWRSWCRRLGLRPNQIQKSRTRNRTGQAVRSGRLKKPCACEDCGNESKKIQAHHEDYTLFLQVEWLCIECHTKRHSGERQGAGGQT